MLKTIVRVSRSSSSECQYVNCSYIVLTVGSRSLHHYIVDLMVGHGRERWVYGILLTTSIHYTYLFSFLSLHHFPANYYVSFY